MYLLSLSLSLPLYPSVYLSWPLSLSTSLDLYLYLFLSTSLSLPLSLYLSLPTSLSPSLYLYLFPSLSLPLSFVSFIPSVLRTSIIPYTVLSYNVLVFTAHYLSIWSTSCFWSSQHRVCADFFAMFTFPSSLLLFFSDLSKLVSLLQWHHLLSCSTFASRSCLWCSADCLTLLYIVNFYLFFPYCHKLPFIICSTT